MKLDPHQIVSVDWLLAHPRGGLIDEMRVGKTAPSIVAASRVAGNALVLCPSISVGQWWREIRTWDTTKVCEWQVCSIDTYARSEQARDRVHTVPYDTVILDEFHYLRNPSTLRAKATYGHRASGKTRLLEHAERIWLLSGTPAPKDASEWWAPMRAIFGDTRTHRQWIEHFCITRETQWGTQVTGNKRETIGELRAMLRQYFIRRTFAEVHGEDKAPLIWNPVVLSGAQLPEEAEAAEADVDRALREQLRGKPMSEVDEAMLAGLKDRMSTLRRVTANVKAPLVSEYVRDYLDADPKHKVLLLGWHTDLLQDVADNLQSYGSALITGQTPPAVKALAAERFQTLATRRVICGNIVACGVSINLSAATLVVMAELDWIPGNNLQAAMRSQHRSKKVPVPVDVLVLAGTVDEAVARVRVRRLQMLSEIHDEEVS